MADNRPPPPPPPHGGAKSSKLPEGNYDIFIIPPHSAGSGFLYLPSLKPNVNSYIAGVFTGVLIMLVERMLEPLFQQISNLSVNSGMGFFVLLAAVGVAFTYGRTQGEHWPFHANEPRTGSSTGEVPNSSPRPRPQRGATYPGAFEQEESRQAPPTSETPKPKSTDANGPTPWEKAREEVRKREAERKRTEDVKKKTEEAQKKKEQEEKTRRAAAEKEKWEQARAREKDARERDARERLVRERAAKDTTPKPGRYEKPTAQSYAESTTSSWKTYEESERRNPLGSSASSVSGLSESSYAASMSTARTTPPPPSQRGPYTTKDPEKIIIDAVYLFNNMLPKPVSQLVRNQGSVTDGLILRIASEGLFIDDDVRLVPQREWDVKAWSIKLVETGRLNNTTVFRATLRDADQKRYIFVLPSDQAWKVDMGLERLRKGSQVRAMGMNGIKDAEMKNLLLSLGWLQ